MTEPAPVYLFHVHRDVPAWRLVVGAQEPFPQDAVAEDWLFTRARTAADTNPDVLRLVEENGFCLFKIGGTFDDITAALAMKTP